MVSCAEMMWMLSVEPSKRGLVSSWSCQLEGMAQAGLARRGWPKPFMLKADTRIKYCSPCEGGGEGGERGEGGEGRREGKERGRKRWRDGGREGGREEGMEGREGGREGV